ncbi:hypothetical protein TNCV_2771171 [Trichonephila clavipes]|nr:hypothetical protein TNCV_2771171 [Trichonephila clavipes]
MKEEKKAVILSVKLSVLERSSQGGYYSSLQWVNKVAPSLIQNLTLVVSRLTGHLTGTSAYAPQSPRSRILIWVQ